MLNKIKLKDRLKSWLVTLGIASVFGLAALGVNAANSYQKTSAYDFQQNGELRFYLDDDLQSSNYDADLFCSFVSDYFTENLIQQLNVVGGWYNASDNNDTFLYVSYDDSELIVQLSFESTDMYFQYNDGHYYLTSDTDATLPCYFYILPQTDLEFYQSLRNYVLSYYVPQQSGNFVTALTDFMSLIGGGIVDLAQTIGAGVVSFASGLFLDSGHLSILGGIIGIFAGIALAVGITSKVYTWVSTLGN